MLEKLTSKQKLNFKFFIKFPTAKGLYLIPAHDTGSDKLENLIRR